MSNSLVIVESPAKARTIKKFLGQGFEVKACMGHVRDLPVKELGVDVENEYRPLYRVIKGKSKVIKELKASAKKAEAIYLAPDPDREGEAIAWHVAQVLGVDQERVHRILFNEITKKAITTAVQNPLEIDMSLVNAQQARRIMDRLLGYKVSPFLWRTLYSGLSAGRVQSVALRLICEREEAIVSFVPQEYWSITAGLQGEKDEPFEAQLATIDGSKVDIKDQKSAEEIVAALQGKDFPAPASSPKSKRRILLRRSSPAVCSRMRPERCASMSRKRCGWRNSSTRDLISVSKTPLA